MPRNTLLVDRERLLSFFADRYVHYNDAEMVPNQVIKSRDGFVSSMIEGTYHADVVDTVNFTVLEAEELSDIRRKPAKKWEQSQKYKLSESYSIASLKSNGKSGRFSYDNKHFNACLIKRQETNVSVTT